MRFFHVLLSVLPAFFWLAVIFGFDEPYIAAETLIAAAAHELGHIIAIFALTGEDISLPRAAAYGLKIKTKRLSYGKEAVAALSGPIVNLLLFALSLTFFQNSEYMISFALINLLTALSNLLPIEGYDGYRALFSFLSLLSPTHRTDRVMRRISFFMSVAITFFSLYLLLRFGEGYWLFAVFFCTAMKFLFRKG